MANDRLPQTRGWRIWIAAVLLAAFALLGLELVWRALGYSPSVTDDEALWAQHYARVFDSDENTLLILGRSRIQEAFVPAAFQEVFPNWDYIQLAIGAKHPLGTLRDVALRSPFHGLVLVSITEASLLPDLWEQQTAYLNYFYNERRLLRTTGRKIATALQSHLTFLLPDLLLQRVLPDLLRGELKRQFLWTFPDRTQRVDYHRVDLAEFRKNQLAQITGNVEEYRQLPSYPTWRDGLGEIERWVQTIENRGGVVVFFRAPTSGEYLARESQYFSKESFWDVFAECTSAHAIHFQDVPAMRALETAEGSHLHLEDTAPFTRALSEELKRIVEQERRAG